MGPAHEASWHIKRVAASVVSSTNALPLTTVGNVSQLTVLQVLAPPATKDTREKAPAPINRWRCRGAKTGVLKARCPGLETLLSDEYCDIAIDICSVCEMLAKAQSALANINRDAPHHDESDCEPSKPYASQSAGNSSRYVCTVGWWPAGCSADPAAEWTLRGWNAIAVRRHCIEDGRTWISRSANANATLY